MDTRAQHIAIVLHDLPLGGTERIALRLGGAWARAGRRVSLLCGHAAGPLAPQVDRAVELVACQPPIPRRSGSRLQLGRALAGFVAERSPDALFIPGNFHWPLLPALAAIAPSERPAIVAQVSTPLFRPGRGPLQQVLYNHRARQRLAYADLLVTLSPRTTRDVDRIFGRRIAQCIPLPALDDDTPGLQRASGANILCAGRLVREKGFDRALRAFAQLRQDNATLTIVGDGPERGALEALAVNLGVRDRVVFAGYVPDVRPWLAEARLLLVTSHYEGYAAVIVESLGAGRQVVSTDCTPAASELLGDDLAGRVTRGGDNAALARALDDLLASPAPDPDILARRVQAYRLAPVAATYLSAFDRLQALRDRRQNLNWSAAA